MSDKLTILISPAVALETSLVAVSSKHATVGVVTYKICNCCGLSKNVCDFYPRRLKCKSCCQHTNRKWELTNPDKVKAKHLRRYLNNLDEEKLRSRNYRLKHPQQLKDWKLKNPNALNEWNDSNRQQRREITNRGHKKLMATINGRINNRMGRMIWESLRTAKAGKTWSEFLSYTVTDLKNHLEKKFKAGMSWARLMNGEIHIDHVIPRSKFTFITPNDIAFKQCWALENLQPLWAEDNISKNNRIRGTPQIPLGI